MMADLHSGYAYTAALLEAVKTVISNSPRSDIRIIVNGDVFESGNFLSGQTAEPGGIDLRLLSELANLAPTFATIGNHDGDLFDPELFAAKLSAINAGSSRSLTLLSNIGDPRRNNALYAPAATASFTVRGHVVRVASIGTPSNSYADNALYARPDPAAYAAALFPGLFTPADFHLALVHAGFVADTKVLPHLKPPFLLHGGHDHLRFTETLAGGQGVHLHPGYWSNGLAVAGINFSSNGVVAIRPAQIQLDRASPADTGLAAAISAAKAGLLTDANNPVVGASGLAYPLDAAVLKAADIVARAADADIGFLSHTTFGDGLPQGVVTKLDLDAFIRFPSQFQRADISGATLLKQVLPATNQFGDFPYAGRTGDFLYASLTPDRIDPDRTYRCVVNAYAVHEDFFGAPLPVFSAVPTLELRALAAAALAGGGVF